MSTIDKNIFEKSGARGCSNSDYNIVKTTCCNTYFVEDAELNDIYFNPATLKKVIDITYANSCPVCESHVWDYSQLVELPRERTDWQWAYYLDQEIVESS